MKTLCARIAFACLLFVPVAQSQSTPAWVQNPVNGNPLSSPPTWPMPMGYTRFAYDPVSQKILYIARQNLCLNWTNSLWAYELPTNTFTMMTWSGSFPNPHNCAKVPGSPAEDTPTYLSDRHNQTVSYDTLRSRLVLYSGDCNQPDMYHWFSSEPAFPATPAGDGWAVDCDPCAPGVRVEGGMTYTDPSSDLLIFYGGQQVGTAKADTWQYDGVTQTWTKILTSCTGTGCVPCGTGCSNLGPRAGQTMVWDAVNQKAVMFGGYAKSFPTPLNDTWEYDPSTHTWSNFSPAVKPPAVKYPALAFDSKRDVIWLHDVLVGGSCSGGCDWTYTTATHTWAQQPEIGGPAPKGSNTQNTLLMDYDAHCDALVATAFNGTEKAIMSYLPLSGALTCSP